MRVTSPAFDDGDVIPAHWCAPDCDDLPRLEIDDVPAEAVTLAVTLDDPDSPLGTVTHWLVWNIPAATRYIDPRALPEEAVVGLDTFARHGGMGPPPPAGEHRYRWQVLALDDRLALPEGSIRSQLDAAVAGHVLARATLTAIVEHPRTDDTHGA